MKYKCVEEILEETKMCRPITATSRTYKLQTEISNQFEETIEFKHDDNQLRASIKLVPF